MPGMELNFRCRCGFHANRVSVGATEQGHNLVVMCLDCHRLFSIWRSQSNYQGRQGRPACKKCGKPLMPITAPGAWGPPGLQNKFPDLEPWLVEDGEHFDEDPTDEELAELACIRILCPKCGSYSLEYAIESLWD